MNVSELKNILYGKEEDIKKAYERIYQELVKEDDDFIIQDAFGFMDNCYKYMEESLERMCYFPYNISNVELLLDLIDNYNYDIKFYDAQKRDHIIRTANDQEIIDGARSGKYVVKTFYEQKRGNVEDFPKYQDFLNELTKNKKEFITIEDIINKNDKYNNFVEFIKKRAFIDILENSKLKTLLDEYNNDNNTAFTIDVFLSSDYNEDKIKIIKFFKESIISNVAKDSKKMEKIIGRYRKDVSISESDKSKPDEDIIEIIKNDKVWQREIFKQYFDGTKLDMILKVEQLDISTFEFLTNAPSYQEKINSYVLKELDIFSKIDRKYMGPLSEQVIKHSNDNMDGFVSHSVIYKDQLDKFMGKDKNSEYNNFIKFVDSGLIKLEDVLEKIRLHFPNLRLNSKEDVVNFLNDLFIEYKELNNYDDLTKNNNETIKTNEFFNLYEKEIKKLTIILKKIPENKELKKLTLEMKRDLFNFRINRIKEEDIKIYIEKLKKSKVFVDKYKESFEIPLICELNKLHRKSNIEKKLYHTMRVTVLTHESIKNKNYPIFFKKIILICALLHDLGRIYQGTFYDSYNESQLLIDENMYGFGSELNDLKHALVGSFMLDNLFDFEKCFGRNRSKFMKILPIVSMVVEDHDKPNSKLNFLDKYCKNVQFSENAKDLFINDILMDIFNKSNTKKKSHHFAYSMHYFKEKLDPFINQFFFSENVRKSRIIVGEKLNSSNPTFANLGEQIRIPFDERDFVSGLKEFLSSDYTDDEFDDEFDKISKKDFKILVSLAMLIVMDIDKTDILVQEAKGWLDNDLDKKNTDVKISFENFFDDGNVFSIDLNEYFGVILDEELCKGIVDENPGSEVKNGIFSQKKDKIKRNMTDYNLIEIKIPNKKISLKDELTEEASKSFWNNKKIMLPDDYVKHYLCLNENESLPILVMRGGNSIQIFWWRINEFLLRNLRMTSSFDCINNINLLEELSKHMSELSYTFGQLVKPILFVAELYIEKVKDKIKNGEFVDGIDEEESKKIRASIRSDLMKMYYPNKDISNEPDVNIAELVDGIDTNKLFCILINSYDNKYSKKESLKQKKL